MHVMKVYHIIDTGNERSRSVKVIVFLSQKNLEALTITTQTLSPIIIHLHINLCVGVLSQMSMAFLILKKHVYTPSKECQAEA